ncbi:MAG: 2-phospho-L-lactate guanylyltransferase [Anaerolineae bacterium]|nr:2-phospho-L-lactate guanylyltransferase [Anaerolineae bacterium]MCB9129975.1 2-phospho-L-lactate guanylyltransferase [Anaerolineales bacterium]MCB0233707.1 2-phospho-L-lactate guanylyltransferase [Anaerolineae bacterium]MCB0247552.1 2-phospho-L-lactate guanylyltransferase [Anaerolineae bacterium]MCB9140916.1 2-phospho-L-lactate guanylyltransferase [Anaerolineales bacterium]
MTLHIVVPVKRLSEAKRRLSPVLGAEDRLALTWSLLRHALAVVQEAQQTLGAQGAVISADPAALEAAREFGLTGLVEEATEDLHAAGPEATLNAALEQAARWASRHNAGALLILPADLPLVTPADINALWQASQQLYATRAMVIAPDGHNSGTNALLVRPPVALQFEFGPDSFHRHCQQAQRLGIAYHVQRSPRLGLDVDLPADLAQFLAVEQADPQDDVTQNVARGPQIDAAAEAFLDQPGLLMRLGTVGRDGFPHVTPVWYIYEAGAFLITTAADRVKARNMLHNPRVGFAIDSDQRPYRGLTATGTARLLAEGEASRELTRRIAARYVPAARLDSMVDSLMQAPRVVFAIDPRHVTRMGSWGEEEALSG